jgi:hypothetical protein
MRGFLSGDNPKMDDANLTHDLLSNLDELETVNFKLFQALGRNGYNPITGVEMLDSEYMELDVKGLVSAVMEYRALVSKTQQAYNQELSGTIKLAKEIQEKTKSTAFNIAIKSSALVTEKAKEKFTLFELKLKEQEPFVIKEDNRKNARKKGATYLEELYRKELEKYSLEHPNLLSKQRRERGVWTDINHLVDSIMENDRYHAYFSNSTESNPPSDSTKLRRFKSALSLLGFPIKVTKN